MVWQAGWQMGSVNAAWSMEWPNDHSTVFCLCVCACMCVGVRGCICAFVNPFPAYKITLCDILFTCSGAPPVVEYYAGTGGVLNNSLEHVHHKNSIPRFSGKKCGMPHEDTVSNTLDALFPMPHQHTRSKQPVWSATLCSNPKRGSLCGVLPNFPYVAYKYKCCTGWEKK